MNIICPFRISVSGYGTDQASGISKAVREYGGYGKVVHSNEAIVSLVVMLMCG